MPAPPCLLRADRVAPRRCGDATSASGREDCGSEKAASRRPSVKGGKLRESKRSADLCELPQPPARPKPTGPQHFSTLPPRPGVGRSHMLKSRELLRRTKEGGKCSLAGLAVLRSRYPGLRPCSSLWAWKGLWRYLRYRSKLEVGSKQSCWPAVCRARSPSALFCGPAALRP